MSIKEIRYEGVDWIHLTHDRDKWWGPVTISMNIRVL
jgi:hypothetical protein